MLRMMSKLMKPTGGQVSIRIGKTEISDEIEVNVKNIDLRVMYKASGDGCPLRLPCG